jgi:superfamily II DNA or RNA helicase
MAHEFEELPEDFEFTQRDPRSLGEFALLGDQLPFSTSTIAVMEEIVATCPEIEVREEQLECLDVLQEARDNGLDRALVQMATGLGKTTIIAADVKRFLGENPKARVLFLCHQNDILAQARERFERIIGPDFTYGNFTGEGKKVFDAVTCLFASFRGIRDWAHENAPILPDDYDYVVVDESHHGKAPTYEPILTYLKPQFMLGVTATPDRHDLKNIREIFGEEIYRLSLEEAIARGLLANVEYKVITDDIADSNILRDAFRVKMNAKQLNRTIFIPKRDEEIVRIVNEHSYGIENPKRIVFCKSVEHAEEYAQYFDQSAPLYSKLPKWQQDRVIEQFRNGEIDTILTIDMFNEGIDIPDANQVIFLRSTQSKTIFLQQLGRGLRKAPGKESVQVLDFVANCDRLAMLDEFWQEIKRYARTGDDSASSETIRIDIGDVHFSEVAREILDILAEIESNNSLYRNWTPEDSKAYYFKLCDTLGRLASAEDIQKQKGPPINVITKPFDSRLANLRTACGFEGYGEPPEHWLSIVSFARENGVTEKHIQTLVKKLGLELPRFQFGTFSTEGLSPEIQSLLIEKSMIGIEPAPDNWVSLREFRVTAKIGRKRLDELVEKHGIETKVHKFGPKIAPAISPAHQEILINAIQSERVENAPEGYTSLPVFAKSIDISPTTLQNIVNRIKLELPTYKFGIQNCKAIGPEHWDILFAQQELNTPLCPKGHYTATGFAKESGIGESRIRRAIRELGLELVPAKVKNGLKLILNTEQQQQIVSFLENE